jgi:hypothetical protein
MIGLTYAHMNFTKNNRKNNILGEDRGFSIHFYRKNRHEKLGSAPVIEPKMSKISYVFQGVGMIKYTARENL